MSGGDAVIRADTVWHVATGRLAPAHLGNALVPRLTDSPEVFGEMQYKEKLETSDRLLLEGLVLEVDNDPRPGSSTRPPVDPVQAAKVAKGDASLISDAFSWESTQQGSAWWGKEQIRGKTREDLRPLVARWGREDAQARRWAGFSQLMDSGTREALLRGEMNTVIRWIAAVRPSDDLKVWKARLDRGSAAAIRDLLGAASLTGLSSSNLGLDKPGDDVLVAMLADGQYRDVGEMWARKLDRMEGDETKETGPGRLAVASLQKAMDPKVVKVLAEHIVESHTHTWVDYGNKDQDINGRVHMAAFCQKAIEQIEAGPADISSNLFHAARFGGRAMPRLAGLNKRAQTASTRKTVLKRLRHMVA